MSQSLSETWSLYSVMMFSVLLLFTLLRKRGRAAILGQGKFFLYCSLHALVETTALALIVFSIFFIDEKEIMIGGSDFKLLFFIVVIVGVIAIKMVLSRIPLVRSALAELDPDHLPTKTK
ncbi:hypothetical protein MCEMIH15_02899 [Caulobacteraceae bacterium]